MLKRIFAIVLAVMTAAAGLAPAEATAGHRNHDSHKSDSKHHKHKAGKHHFKHRGFGRHHRFGHRFHGFGHKRYFRDFGHRHRFRHRGFKRHYDKGHHHGGFSSGFSYGPKFFSPYRYHRPRRRVYHGTHDYIHVTPYPAYSGKTAPWTTAPSEPEKETAPVYKVPAETNTVPAAVIQSATPAAEPASITTAEPLTTSPAEPEYIDIGAYDTAGQSFTEAPLTETYVGTPAQSEALLPLETVPLN